ncbi:MAG: DUF4294 domain-containing protein [Bacteroidales bacterium]|nr:DUF4294 domain-containing protein [Bacteroidales bacterium]MBS3774164.1 DUF4294 domain-containing protein [Bacteroidales bacterium]
MKMNGKYILFLFMLFFLFAVPVFSQNGDTLYKVTRSEIKDTMKIEDMHLLKAEEVDGETLASIEVQEVVVYPEIKFDNRRKYRKYQKLVKNLKKVYPYAQKAKYKLIKMEREFQQLESEKERRKYIKKVEKEIKEEFKQDIKKLTISQGRLLLKLIDRETGNTSYQLLDELKGSFSAFFWQTIARVFGHDLKAEYDPNGRDWMIERIVTLIEHNQI